MLSGFLDRAMTAGPYYRSDGQGGQPSTTRAAMTAPNNSSDTHSFLEGGSNVCIILIQNNQDGKLGRVVES